MQIQATLINKLVCNAIVSRKISAVL